MIESSTFSNLLASEISSITVQYKCPTNTQKDKKDLHSIRRATHASHTNFKISYTQNYSTFQCPVIPSPSVSKSISPPNRISRVYNPNVAKVLIHLHVRKPPHAPLIPKIHVHDPPVDAAGVNVDNRRFVYVAMRIIGEYNTNIFINLED